MTKRVFPQTSEPLNSKWITHNLIHEEGDTKQIFPQILMRGEKTQLASSLNKTTGFIFIKASQMCSNLLIYTIPFHSMQAHSRNDSPVKVSVFKAYQNKSTMRRSLCYVTLPGCVFNGTRKCPQECLLIHTRWKNTSRCPFTEKHCPAFCLRPPICDRSTSTCCKQGMRQDKWSLKVHFEEGVAGLH